MNWFVCCHSFSVSLFILGDTYTCVIDYKKKITANSMETQKTLHTGGKRAGLLRTMVADFPAGENSQNIPCIALGLVVAVVAFLS